MAFVSRKCDPRVATATAWSVSAGTAVEAVTKAQELPAETPAKTPYIFSVTNGQLEKYKFALHPELKTLIEAGGKIVGAVTWISGENQTTTGKPLIMTWATKTVEPEFAKLSQGTSFVSSGEAYALANYTTANAFEEAEVILEKRTTKELRLFEVMCVVTVEEAAVAAKNPVSMLV